MKKGLYPLVLSFSPLVKIQFMQNDTKICCEKIIFGVSTPQTSKKHRLFSGMYHLPCLSHQYCQWLQQKKLKMWCQYWTQQTLSNLYVLSISMVYAGSMLEAFLILLALKQSTVKGTPTLSITTMNTQTLSIMVLGMTTRKCDIQHIRYL